MVRITLELIRKRSEHNEGEISTLEEISLHQENIDKIELIDRVCRNLKILLLQYNLISKIENLSMLKRLEYLNLALNNIEVIENLEGLESLKKLDLTVNFIGDLKSVKKLRCNENLEQLILTGNPCTEYEGYREYVIATLTQIKELDMMEIERSERIKALQVYAQVKSDIIRDHRDYKRKREAQIVSYHEREKAMYNLEVNDEQENEKFWKGPSYHTPEDRVAIAERTQRREQERKQSENKSNEKHKYTPRLFSPDGRPYNVNQAKLTFKLNDEDDRENIILDVGVYRHLDTSYVNVDVQPNYVRVTVKGKVLQLTLPCEVSIDKSNAKRNTTTGNLVITMPRLKPLPFIVRPKSHEENKKLSKSKKKVLSVEQSAIPRREFLEIGSSRNDLDFSKIFENSTRCGKDRKRIGENEESEKKENEESKDFVDDPNVPPLE